MSQSIVSVEYDHFVFLEKKNKLRLINELFEDVNREVTRWAFYLHKHNYKKIIKLSNTKLYK